MLSIHKVILYKDHIFKNIDVYKSTFEWVFYELFNIKYLLAKNYNLW